MQKRQTISNQKINDKQAVQCELGLRHVLFCLLHGLQDYPQHQPFCFTAANLFYFACTGKSVTVVLITPGKFNVSPKKK